MLHCLLAFRCHTAFVPDWLHDEKTSLEQLPFPRLCLLVVPDASIGEPLLAFHKFIPRFL